MTETVDELSFNPFLPGFTDDPYPHFAELRERRPIEVNELGVDFRTAFATDEAGMAWVLRVPRRPDVLPRAENEARALRLLKGRLPHTFVLEVVNDGVQPPSNGPRKAGMGLRLAAFEALESGGIVEFGPAGEDRWRVRLTVPFEQAPA